MQNNFLAKIWGDAEGYRCVVVGKSMRHIFFEDNSHLGNHKDKDQWFAPSILKSQERKIENVVSTKAFWLDIDCGPGKAYESQEKAAYALRDFTSGVGLLDPTVVSSGNGLHIYWILKEPAGPAAWFPIAQALRQACVDLNLKADHSITIDIARILRVPGTKNYKDPKNPKPVEVLNENEPCSIQEIEEALADYIFKAELAEKAKEANKNFAIEFAQTPKDADRIADGCAQMSRLRDTRGNIPEPEWYAGLGVLALCTDGAILAHQWSAGHPKYNKQATDRKFDRAKKFAPTTCQKFYEVNPDLCKACPYFGKISSPVQLGESVTPLNLPAKEPAKTDQNQALEITQPQENQIVPKPYLCGKEGVWKMIPATDTEGPEKQYIARKPIWVSRVMVGEDGSGSEIELSWIDAEGRSRSQNFKHSLVAHATEFDGELRDKNIHFHGNVREFIQYIKSCVDHTTERQKTEIVYNKFGFTRSEDKFLIGRDLISASGIKSAYVSAIIDPERVELMAVRGSSDDWKRAGNYLNQPQFWPHRFTILACLGTPLLRLSGNKGSVLSLSGETSGGKTTAANVGIAAFADHEAFTIDPATTTNAFYEHWRQASNLPLVVNEADEIRHDILKKLIMAAANGKARDGLTQSRELFNAGTWDTLTIFTSNVQLHELSGGVISDAAKKRILEIPFLPENCLPRHLGHDINRLIKKSYGHAGREFVRAILSESEYLADRLNERVVKIENGIHTSLRYNLWLIAAASVAAEIAEGLGLIDFETTDCIANTLDILKTNVRETLTPRDQVEALIAQYTQKFQGGIGHKEGSNNGWHREPVGSAMGRVTTQKDQIGELALPIRQFKEFALENGVDLNRVRKYMTKTKLVRLSRVGNGVECWILPWEGEE